MALSDGRHKLIHDLETGRYAYFDLAADPGELDDRSGDPAAAAEIERLQRDYRALEQGLPRAGATSEELDPGALEVLEQMGYVGEGSARAEPDESDAPGDGELSGRSEPAEALPATPPGAIGRVD